MKDRFMGRLGGFTLIELLVVVLIIGVLTAVALPQYEKAVEKARSAQAMIFLDTFIKGQKMYYLANSEYFLGSLDDFDVTGVKLPVLQAKDWQPIYSTKDTDRVVLGIYRLHGLDEDAGDIRKSKYSLWASLGRSSLFKVCSGGQWCKSFGITTPCENRIILSPGEEKDWCYIESGFVN